MKTDTRKLSKRLSYLLRHDKTTPFEEGGWVSIDYIFQKLSINKDELFCIVENDTKGRYLVKEERIRALYGHSVPVDLKLEPVIPPDVLYHGTSENAIPGIMAKGIIPKSRNFVHLSEDIATAVTVGNRHGKPVVLEIDAKKMYENGNKFYNPNKGIWLTDKVVNQHIKIL